MTSELQDFEDLVTSKGWMALETYWRREYAIQVENGTLSALKQDDAAALAQLRQIVASKRAVEMLLQWPHDQIKSIKQGQQPRPVAYTRGGV